MPRVSNKRVDGVRAALGKKAVQRFEFGAMTLPGFEYSWGVREPGMPVEDVVIEVDFAALIAQLAGRAANSKRGYCAFIEGAVKVSARKAADA